MWLKSISLIFMLLISTPSFSDASRWEGMPLVEFNLKDQYGKTRNNKEFQGQWLILYFYPKDNTRGCTIEAQNFALNYGSFQLLNSEIVGVSYDDVESHRAFSDQHKMPFVLLSDEQKKLTKALEVDSIFPWPHASRQTFIIDPNGIIMKHYDDVSPENHAKQLLKDLERLQKLKSSIVF